MWRDFVGGLCDLLSPPACAACDGALDARVQGFCDACRPLIDPIALPSGEAPPSDLAACVYGGPLRDALQRFKYEQASELAGQLAPWLSAPAKLLVGRVDLVTVVPLHPRRLRERGYNQAALLAGPLARQLALPYAPSLLRRTRDTPAQVGLGRSERRAQLAGAFVASPRARDRRVLVIDDVRTTGSTFEEARRALTLAGAHQVFTLALAAALTSTESEPTCGL